MPTAMAVPLAENPPATEAAAAAILASMSAVLVADTVTSPVALTSLSRISASTEPSMVLKAMVPATPTASPLPVPAATDTAAAAAVASILPACDALTETLPALRSATLSMVADTVASTALRDTTSPIETDLPFGLAP